MYYCCSNHCWYWTIQCCLYSYNSTRWYVNGFLIRTHRYIYITLIFDFCLSVPSAPPIMALTSLITSNGFTISWNPPGYNDQNGVIIYYSVSVVEVETGSIFQYISYTTTLTIQPLHPSYTYQYRIAAYTIGLGPYSDPINITTAEEGKPLCPLNVAIFFQ